jgi:hypothetical protein
MRQIKSLGEAIDAIRENKQVVKLQDGLGLDTEKTEPIPTDELLAFRVGHAAFCVDGGLWFTDDDDIGKQPAGQKKE